MDTIIGIVVRTVQGQKCQKFKCFIGQNVTKKIAQCKFHNPGSQNSAEPTNFRNWQIYQGFIIFQDLFWCKWGFVIKFLKFLNFYCGYRTKMIKLSQNIIILTCLNLTNHMSHLQDQLFSQLSQKIGDHIYHPEYNYKENLIKLEIYYDQLNFEQNSETLAIKVITMFNILQYKITKSASKD